jgi:SPP1 gp7 family putative phage head morphogenesis protein
VDFSKWKAKEMIWELWPAHVQAVNALLNTSKNYVKSSLDGLERQTMSLIGELQQQRVREELAKWILKGESRFEVNKRVTKYFEEQNLWFKDRAWRVWTMDRYVDMLTRTETAIANVQGTINRWIQVWLTKFRVIEHFDCCSNICSHYNGEVFDVSKGMVNLPPYHPNCRGYIEAVIDWHDWGYHKELERKATYLWEWENGSVYRGLKWDDAIQFLKSRKDWEVRDAYEYKWKPIDLVRWKTNKETNDKGFWLSKILEKHPNMEKKITDLLNNTKAKESKQWLLVYDNGKERAIVMPQRKGEEKRRLLTAYEKDENFKNK